MKHSQSCVNIGIASNKCDSMMASFNVFLLSVVTIAYSTGICDEISYFKSMPTTVKAHENNTVLLPCYLDTANNDIASVTRVKWYKDDELWADSGTIGILPPDRFRLWSNGSLEVVNVQPPDTGEYTCEIIRSSPWSPVRQVHAIEVLHPPSIEPTPSDGFLQVKLGDEVRMECRGSGVPKPIITWSSKGEDMQLIGDRSVLSFTASDRRLSGTYECRASNGEGEPAKATIVLNIVYPPVLSTPKSWMHSAPGHRADLECTVSADPTATVTWFKSDNPVMLDGRVISLINSDKHTLIIRNVKVSDFGIYTCRAMNALGQASIEFQLSGAPNPAVFKKTDDKNLNAKDSYTLIWEVDSYSPVIDYKLLFRVHKPSNNVRKHKWTMLTIPNDHNNNVGPVYSKLYTIQGLKEKTVYEAQLISRNRFGSSKESPNLIFATSGADLKEEIVTPALIEIHENLIPLEVSAVDASTSMRISFIRIEILLLIYCFVVKIK